MFSPSFGAAVSLSEGAVLEEDRAFLMMKTAATVYETVDKNADTVATYPRVAVFPRDIPLTNSLLRIKMAANTITAKQKTKGDKQECR